MLGKITPKENNMAKGGEVTYLFDVKLFACLRISAVSESAARHRIETLLDVATVNFGEIDGEPIVGEASIDGEPDLVEIDPD
jgi:hypothetical protein